MTQHTSLKLAALAFTLALSGCPRPIDPQVLPPAPQVLVFTATPSVLDAPGMATLTWDTKDATSVEIVDSESGPLADVGNRSSGTLQVQVATSRLFVLRATNTRDLSDSAAARVELKGAPQTLFTASPEIVGAGEASVLAWSASDAREVSIVDGTGAALDLKGQKSFGSLIVRPELDTVYTLRADATMSSTTVSVRPAVQSFVASPAFGRPGGSVNLSWQTQGATKVTLSRAITGVLVTETGLARVKSGSHMITLPVDAAADGVFTFVLRAEGTNPAAATVQELQLYISDTPRISSFTAPGFGVLGGKITLSWETVADQVEILAGGSIIYRTPSVELATVGSLELNTPVASTEYTLRATNLRGGVASDKRVVAPVGVTTLTAFTANPLTIAAGGDPVTLTWNAPNARIVKIVANAEYTVFTGRGPGIETGSVTVYPNGPTSYVFTADNTLGNTVTGTQTVTVTAPALVGQSPVGPVVVGSTVNLSVSAGGAGAKLYGVPQTSPAVRPASAGFIDISATGTKLAFLATADNNVLSFTAPDFETWLWGKRLAGNVVVSTNGFLVLGPTALVRAAPIAIPSSTIEPHLFAPYWADLSFSPQSAIYWEVRGEAPNRELVVQWDKLKVKAQATSEVTFEARIHQTGTINYEYKTLTTPTAPAVGVGVQGPAANLGVAFGGGVTSSSGLTFFEPRTNPASYAVDSAQPLNAWVGIGTGYLKVTYTPQLLQPGSLVISEAMHSPAAAIAATGEWIEIFNTSNAPFELAGFTLDFGGGLLHTVAAAGGTTAVPPGGVLVLGQSNVAAENDGVAVQYVYGPTFAMTDGAGTIRLTTAGSPIASLTWSAGQGGVGASVAGDPGPVLNATDPAGTLPHPVNCSSTAPFGTQAPQQLGTPGALSQCYPYRLSKILVDYEDTFTTGTEVLGSVSDYSGVGTVTLPAPFPYFGVPQTTINLSMVGFATFGPPLTAAYDTVNNTGVQTTVPNGVIALFWDQIVRNTSGKITMQRKTNYTIISWDDFRIYASSGSSMHFQLKLFDSGVIEFHYGTMVVGNKPNETGGSTATTWIETLTGDSALVVNLNKVGGLQPDSAWRFTP
jgi:hypothetical protein